MIKCPIMMCLANWTTKTPPKNDQKNPNQLLTCRVSSPFLSFPSSSFPISCPSSSSFCRISSPSCFFHGPQPEQQHKHNTCNLNWGFTDQCAVMWPYVYQNSKKGGGCMASLSMILIKSMQNHCDGDRSPLLTCFFP